ncbi:IS5 family transposase [Pseudomonas sp. S34]|nr:IS5 family transposase [Pseudomonas sp. S34]
MKYGTTIARAAINRHRSDLTNAPRILTGRKRPKGLGSVRKVGAGRIAAMIGWRPAWQKGYDAEHLRQYCDRYRMQPVIPQRTMKRKPNPGLPRLFDRPKYRQRNIIERMFAWLKESRRIGTRYDKLAKSFAAMVTLACTLRCLRHYFSYKT